MLTAAETLEACVRALNSLYIKGYEKRAGIAWIAGKPHRVPLLLARAQALIAEREADPSSLENWGRRQRFSRAYAATGPDLSTPSHFNTRKEYTTR